MNVTSAMCQLQREPGRSNNIARERGELVTFVAIISATGVAVTPVFVYPRLRNPEDYLGESCPNSAVALGNSKELLPSSVTDKSFNKENDPDEVLDPRVQENPQSPQPSTS
ncbi:hypothetical protein ILUMI_17797 [Ignelater luminosus]|uniref:Uncharacterized protein n=1 Tax=Ignelater luminosus TaxID=2038154 RepID=A0A8K0CND3_IGNLU|nr:hypothetical protein ILUMI_17797 [Ignelater luminosus]